MMFLFSASNLFAAELPDTKQEFLAPDQAFKMSVSSLGNKQVQITWDISSGYYLYMGMFEFSTDVETTNIINAEMPDGLKKKDEFFGDVDVYYQSTYAKLTFDNISENTNLVIKYQGCADAGLCYPPIKKTKPIRKSNGYIGVIS